MKELMGRSAGAYPQVIATVAGNTLGAGKVPARGRARPKIVDAEGIERALELAALTLRPDEVSGRELVKRLMLHLFKLRKRGFSFNQLTRVINDAIGEANAKLKPDTVKAYYNEFIAERQDECSEQLKASLQIIAEVEKLTAKSSQQLVAEAVQLKTAISVSRGSTATSRVMGGQVGGDVVAVGVGVGVDAAVVNLPQRSVANSTAPSVPVLTAQMEAGDLVVPDLVVPDLVISSQDNSVAVPSMPRVIDDIPVPSLPAMAAPAAKSMPKSALKTSPTDGVGAVVICATVPTPDTIHPTTADLFTANPQAFFSDAVLEHPEVPGLMLSRDQRLYTKRLEYTVDGVAKMEAVKEMFNRYKWRSVPKATPSRTEGDFVKMDTSLFTNNA